MKTNTRLKVSMPVPRAILRSLFFTIAIAYYMTSLTATIAVAVVGLAAIGAMYAVKWIILTRPVSRPTQGWADALEREIIISNAIRDEVLNGRDLTLSVVKSKIPNAFSISNKKRVRLIFTQQVYDYPIEQFMGIALHEAAHAAKPQPMKQYLFLFVASSIAEILLAATGLTFGAALGWAAVMTLASWPVHWLFYAKRRRIEFACDAYAQTKGGDIFGGLVSLSNDMKALVGAHSPRRLWGIENIWSSHPSFDERFRALMTVPAGVLDMHGYTGPAASWRDSLTRLMSLVDSKRAS